MKGLPEQLAWRLMLGLAAVPAIILFFGVLRLPESPRFLVKNNKVEEAKQVLSFIRPADEVDAELKTIQEMDGEQIRAAVAKPCINIQDEGYNVEWSTELTVQEAYDEYIKAIYPCYYLRINNISLQIVQ